MNEKKYPPGWDAKRVQELIDYYENLSDEEQLIEDEQAAEEREEQSVITVPSRLLPAIRQLIAHSKSA